MTSPRLLISLVLLGVILLAASASFFTVRENRQVLVLRFGETNRVITTPGLNFKITIMDTIEVFEKRLLSFDGEPQEIPTVDQKQLVVDSYAKYQIVDALRFFQTVGSDAGMRARLPNIINSALRQVLGDVPLSRVLTAEREALMAQSTALANRNAQEFGIKITDVRMKRVDLPEQNSNAVFRRMQTQREQEARKFRAEGDKESRTIRADADRQQRIIIADARKDAEILRGEGDAQAQAIYNSAYSRDPEFFDFWRSMQAMERGLTSQTTTYVGPPAGDFFRFFAEEGGPTARPISAN